MKKLFLLFVAALSLQAGSVMGQEQKQQRSINVTGNAEMEVVPDEIFVHVELREYDKRNGGKVDIEQIRNAFIKAAMSIGIPETDLSVQSYQGWDGNFWWYRKNKKKNPDMKASITYEVKLASTKKMDELVQKMDDEATQRFNIARVSHSKLEDFKKQLKIQAVKSAKEKAGYLADAIGESVGHAITINEPNEVRFYPQYARMAAQESMMDDGAGQPAPNIDFKKMKLEFNVHVVFALK